MVMGSGYDHTDSPSYIITEGSSEPHPAHDKKLCEECMQKSRDVFNRASFRGKKLLCRECVEIVEDERQSKKVRETIDLIMENYKE